MTSIALQADLLENIHGYLKSVYPEEGCGLLIGRGNQASRFLPAPNILSSEIAYEIDPALLASTFRSLRESGENLVAIVHSHPRGPAEPSKTDRERAFYPDAAYLIVSFASPESLQSRAFRIIDGTAYEIEVHVIL